MALRIASKRGSPFTPRAALLLAALTFVATACARGAAPARVQIRALETTPVAAASIAVTPVSEQPTLAAPAAPAILPPALAVGFSFPIDDISSAEAQALLAGQIARWSEAGGPDLPVRRLTWERGAVRETASIDPAAQPAVTDRASLLAAVAQQPGAVSLLAWDGLELHAKALTIDGRRAGEPEYAALSVVRAWMLADGPALESATPSNRFLVAAVGDLMLGRRVAQLAGAQGFDFSLARAAPALSGCDVAIANLEVALTARGQPERKDYMFRAPIEFAMSLRASGITAVSLANNHVIDYGSEGLADTVSALNAAGVAHAGAGANDGDAAAAAIIDVHGTRVALLSFANVPTDANTGFSPRTTAASATKAGVDWGTPEAVAQQVSAARARADTVIVSLHAGTEYASEPNDVQRSLAHAAIDAGAALVLGTHPHVLQGIEYYKNGVILYSLGNFVFDLDRDDLRNFGPPPAQTVVARLQFEGGRVRGLELRPMVIDPFEFRPVPASGAAARSVLDRVYRLTDALNAR